MASVWAELKRRNVVKVAVAYAIVAWLLVQIIVSIEAPLNLPDWTDTLVIVLMGVGFVVAVFLAWAYELTPEGMKKTRSVPLSESVTRVTGRKLDFVIIGLMALGIGFLVVDNYVLVDANNESSAPETPAQTAATTAAGDTSTVELGEPDVLPNSVAVLPLENLSPDPDNAYFAAGIHEEILNHLAKLRNLNVISRTSMVRYADSDLSIPEIAAELNVGTVMEGSVRYADNRVLVTMQLIDPETDAHLWSESYNRELADVFAIQADVAMNVANALEAEFSLAERESIEAVPTDSPEAYALYLRAVSLLNSGSFIAVAELLDAAIRLDPDFALAYEKKALLYANILTGNVPEQQAELERITQESAERALVLDPTLGAPHAALAFVHQAHWRWDEAELEFEEALRLSPNNAEMLGQYSRAKRFRGEYAAAVSTARRAAELDPQNFGNHYQLGINYRYARDYDAAAESLQLAMILSLDDGYARAQLAYAEVSRGNWADAVSELEVAERIWGSDIQSQRYPQLAYAYAQMGRRDVVERLYAALQTRAQERPVNAALWALMYVAMEDYDQALDSLESAVDDEAPDWVTLGEIKANPYADPVLDEPRFQTLRDRIGT
ncbi:MAG: hypothetical protein ACR2QQ_00660 [Gammaproteobacteria bacterium]